jgi:hypothetical protein
MSLIYGLLQLQFLNDCFGVATWENGCLSLRRLCCCGSAAGNHGQKWKRMSNTYEKEGQGQTSPDKLIVVRENR